MPALEGLAAAAEEEQRPTALSVSHGVTVTPRIMRPPSVVSNVVELQRRIAPRRGEEERADTPYRLRATTK